MNFKKIAMIRKMILGVLALGIFATSCSNDDDGSTPSPATSTLTIDFTGLAPLGDNYVYEGWIIVDGAPVSTGVLTSLTFPQTIQIATEQLAAATKFVLSIEPESDTDPAPAATKILAGDFSGNSANVLPAPVTTDASNFLSSTGKFFLRTPTDEAAGSGNNMNDEYGIWFGTPGAPPTAGLDLPTLSAGWKYEGWVVVEGVGPISTGTFTGFAEVDDSNNFSGTENNAGPPIPGEDFFLNAPAGFTFPLDVRGRDVVISIEPDPDNSTDPFSMKPLAGTAGNDTAPTTYDLALNLVSLPSGTVSR